MFGRTVAWKENKLQPLVKQEKIVKRPRGSAPLMSGRSSKIVVAVTLGILTILIAFGCKLCADLAGDYKSLETAYETLKQDYDDALRQRTYLQYKLSLLQSELSYLQWECSSLDNQLQQSLAYLQKVSEWVG